MISYAQNFEDVMLRRVFRDRKDGFYIDVGAMDPTLESVTRFFYDEGWTGINIEPNEFFYRKLVEQRPRDINLNVAVGDHEGRQPLYVFEEYGISTFESQYRDRFIERGYTAEEKNVEITTLAAICGRHVQGHIDFLKVDCEGWEQFVLRGADWQRFRPTVLLVEATQPGTDIAAWQEWEPFLIENAQYEFVYFDGLNRYYLPKERANLRSCFETPPNILEEFQLFATVKAEQESAALKQERDTLAARTSELEAQNTRDREEIARLSNDLHSASQQVANLSNDLQSANKEIADLREAVLRWRLWIGKLSQELAARKRR